MSHADAERKVLWRRFVQLSNRLQLTYYLIRFGELLTAVLPVRVSYALATAIADGLYFGWGMLRKQIAANVGVVLGEAADATSVAATSRSVLRNYLKYLVDFVGLPSFRKDELERIVQLGGMEHLDHARQAGKGVIFVGLHFGSFEVAGALMAQRGYRVHVVVDSFEPPKLDALIQRRRAKHGLILVPYEATTAGRRLLRALHSNEILGLLIDRPLGDAGIAVEFCGGITRVPAGPATLALKTGAKLLPGYCVRQNGRRFVGTILPHVEIEPTGDSRHDVQRLTQRLMASLETCVREYPDQWYMFREMWPRRDQGSVARLAEA